MNTGERIAKTFFDAFSTKNYAQMGALYKSNVNGIFSDPVFQNLNSDEVAAMWKMLLRGTQDLTLSYKFVTADENSAEVDWVAHYTYPPTKRKVKNTVKSKFIFENEKIISQFDSFDLCAWTRQALPVIVSDLFCLFPNYTIRKIARSKLNQQLNRRNKN
jgi:hypothetical protein